MRIIYEVSVHDLNMEYLGKVVREFKNHIANYGSYNDLVNKYKKQPKFIKIIHKRNEDQAKVKVSFKFSKSGNHQKGKEYFIELLDTKSFGDAFEDFVLYTEEINLRQMDSYKISEMSADTIYKIICELDVMYLLEEA